ncbi:MAG TPA: DUF4190 domain-containing protein [Anaerolineales bacterium]|nr:DUF4190 domain-containing protein [Anaerolineales bacterium]
MMPRPVPNKLARTSLILGLVGWFFYLLQFCFDLTVGLLLTAMTGGTSAICSFVLDFLPLVAWLAGILAGHVALGQIRQTGAPGRSQAIWGLVLGYVGMTLTILFFVVVIILVISGVSVGLLDKVIPMLPKR